jgi:methionine-rich copper-binding protein CopC
MYFSSGRRKNIVRRASYRLWVILLLNLLLLTAGANPAWAHAILVQSSPALNATVQGPDVPIHLRFNVRIDGGRSRVHLLKPDGSTQLLTIAKQATPDVLDARASGLKPGVYKLHWQVLASDGHISNGIVSFTVN